MNDNFEFAVEDRTFSLERSFLDAGRFNVKSIPRSYDVVFVSETPAATINRLMSKEGNTLLFIDSNVFALHRGAIRFPENRTLVAEATEEFKTLTGVEKLTDFLDSRCFTKADHLVVVGGGIIQDVGAFAGACFKRGIKWTFIPTTLLSMCDSCIGGKTGINYKGAKNQLALFSSPAEVVINTQFLETLNERDVMSGMGEILKLMITGGKDLLGIYREHVHAGRVLDHKDYTLLIRAALGVKKLIVEEDEFELNIRRSLNYGHTVGHALEILSAYRIPHGEAVSMGIIVANRLSHAMGIMSNEDVTEINKLAFDLCATGIQGAIQLDGLESLLRKDKKTLGGKAVFVLVEQAGVMRFAPVEMTSAFVRQILDVISEEFG